MAAKPKQIKDKKNNKLSAKEYESVVNRGEAIVEMFQKNMDDLLDEKAAQMGEAAMETRKRQKEADAVKRAEAKKKRQAEYAAHIAELKAEEAKASDKAAKKAEKEAEKKAKRIARYERYYNNKEQQ